MMRMYQSPHDLVSSALIVDQMLASKAYSLAYGDDKVHLTPICFSTCAEAELAEVVQRYQKLYPGQKILFDVYLGAHGNEELLVVGGHLTAEGLHSGVAAHA